MKKKETGYEKVVRALERGDSGEILKVTKTLQNRANRAEKRVGELKIFLESAQLDLIDGDYENLIGDIDKVLGILKGSRGK